MTVADKRSDPPGCAARAVQVQYCSIAVLQLRDIVPHTDSHTHTFTYPHTHHGQTDHSGEKSIHALDLVLVLILVLFPVLSCSLS